MRKKTLMLLLGLALAFTALCAEQPNFMPEITLGGMPFTRIEVVNTPESRARGLMERTYLPEDGGMCFVMDDIGPVSFWMKNTRIPLDAIFIDPYGRVLAVATMAVEAPQGAAESVSAYEARLRHYRCDGPVYCVVELAAGAAGRLGITAGSTLPAFSLSALQSLRSR